MLWAQVSRFLRGGIFVVVVSAFHAAHGAELFVASTRDQYCSNLKVPGYAQQIIAQKTNRLAFANPDGIAKIGLCWWHSRFTMAAAYITVYKPNEPKPSDEQAARLIRQIRKMDSLVVIPGFHNLNEFSKAYADEIRSQLLNWQLADTYWWSWLRGLMGSSEVSPDELGKIMDDTFDKVEYQKRVVYQMLQLSGPAAHSWLVIKMRSTHNGYKLFVVDSNFGDVQVWDYERGMTHFEYPSLGPFVPYTQSWTLEEEQDLRKIGKQFCQQR